jgi:hypothetical protein
MDFLAAYLFPGGERVIDEFIPTGISLGGEYAGPGSVGHPMKLTMQVT